VPNDIRATLPLKYRKMLLSEVKTKNFCEKASFDERISFFSLLGMRFGLSIFPNSILNGVSTKEFVKNYDKGQSYEAIKKQILLDVYVTSDKDIIHQYGLMSQVTNQPSTIRLLDFNKIGNITKDWDKRLNTPEQNELLSVVEDSDLLVKTIHNAIVSSELSNTLFELNSLDMQVLMFLYINRSYSLVREKIQRRFTEYTTPSKVTTSLKRLLEGEYVKKHISMERDLKFTITGRGISKVQDYINYVLKANNF
jgi:DNA-binding MarR family transcriptional regulator